MAWVSSVLHSMEQPGAAWVLDKAEDDSYIHAIAMVTPFWRLVANNWLLNRLVVDVLLRTLKPTHTVIILRIRYAEDRLREAISSGRFDAALIGAGFDPEAPASLAWLGVTCYLAKEAVSDTIDQIAAGAAPGSRVVLDYRYPRRLVPAAGLALVAKMDRLVERRGEPMLSEYSPDEIDAEMERAGFTAVEYLSPAEQTQRFLQVRHDIPEPPPNFAFALFRTSRLTVARR